MEIIIEDMRYRHNKYNMADLLRALEKELTKKYNTVKYKAKFYQAKRSFEGHRYVYSLVTSRGFVRPTTIMTRTSPYNIHSAFSASELANQIYFGMVSYVQSGYRNNGHRLEKFIEWYNEMDYCMFVVSEFDILDGHGVAVNWHRVRTGPVEEIFYQNYFIKSQLDSYYYEDLINFIKEEVCPIDSIEDVRELKSTEFCYEYEPVKNIAVVYYAQCPFDENTDALMQRLVDYMYSRPRFPIGQNSSLCYGLWSECLNNQLFGYPDSEFLWDDLIRMQETMMRENQTAQARWAKTLIYEIVLRWEDGKPIVDFYTTYSTLFFAAIKCDIFTEFLYSKERSDALYKWIKVSPKTRRYVPIISNLVPAE